MSKHNHNIVVDTFIVQSVSAEEYIKYMISLDLHCRHRDLLIEDSDVRFVQVRSLDVYVHYGAFCSISYSVIFGRGFRLPRIIDKTD